MSDKTPFTSLTDKDCDLIQEYIDRYAVSPDSNTYYAEIKPLETVLAEWNKAKNEALFKMFGGELILRRLFTYKQTSTGLAREIEHHYSESEPQAFHDWWNWSIKRNGNVKFTLDNTEGSSTELASYFYSKFYCIEQAFSYESLAANAYNGDDFKILFEDGTIFKVSTGMKPMKIIHKFVEKYGDSKAETIFENFRLWHSRLLNQKTVDGELCLSIHPLDYMTMSDNANGWTSCMRWSNKFGEVDPGDYRAGTIECMNSPYIIVAYLHNPKKPLIHGNFEWNSKRWRELFIVNEGCISEIKGYPYQEENLTNGCISWIKELAQKNLGWTYNDEEVNMRDFYIIDDNNTIMFDFISSGHMYKDIGTLNKHAGRINLDVLRDTKKFHHWSMTTLKSIKEDAVEIPYGGIGTCVYCGEELVPGRDSSVLCGRCEMVDTCACCGEAIEGEDKYWIDELDDYICYDCYCDRCMPDSFSEESHLIENMTSIYLFLGYDYENRPVFYGDKVADCFEPENNYYYQKAVTQRPEYGWDKHYITLDMVNTNNLNIFCDAFDIYPRDLNKFLDTCYGNYDIYYDCNGKPLYDEEEEEDE